MIYYFLFPLHTSISAFNVFRYITFRTIYASLTAFIICFLLGPWVIRKLSYMQVGQYIREDGPQSHLKKAGTPTMGGTLIIFSVAVATVLWADLTNLFVWIVLMVLMGFGTIGFVDDYLMQVKKRSKGLTARGKLILQTLLALAVGVLLVLSPDFTTRVTVPFFKQLSPVLGWWYVPFAAFVIVGASNAVNLTDGLDGLAIGPTIIAAVTYMIFSYVAGHIKIAEYLQINYVPRSGELAVFLRCIGGRRPGFPVVQRLPGTGLHGGCGLSLPGRKPGDRGGHYQTGDFAGPGGRALCDGGPVGDFSGGFFQNDQGQAYFPHGAAPSPF